MWLTLLWQNKGLVALVACLVAFVGLGIAFKVQSSRLEMRTQERDTAITQRDVAIEAHDDLVNEWNRQQQILASREELRKAQEAENAKLHKTLRDILSQHQAWAAAPLPFAIVGLLSNLSTVPAEVGTTAPSGSR